MARLLLIDTADELPGLLPLHAWSALMTSEQVVLGHAEHPFAPYLQAEDLRVEYVPGQASDKPLTRTDLLGGLSPEDKGRADWVVDQARSLGEIAYVTCDADTDAFVQMLSLEAARAGVEVEMVFLTGKPRGTKLLKLVQVMERLRSDDGCPWDKEQTHTSLAPHAAEEVFELLDAISSGEPANVAEELGDVLLQVVFHAEIAASEDTFDIDVVAEQIAQKLIRRHPHVFADTTAETPAEVKANWEAIKAEEKPERTGPFDGLATAQPGLALMGAYFKRARRLGFGWENEAEAVDDVRAELREFCDAATDAEREGELGDLIAATVGLAREYGIDPELALRGSAQRFRERFEHAVANASGDPKDLTREQWLDLWSKAKSSTAQSEQPA